MIMHAGTTKIMPNRIVDLIMFESYLNDKKMDPSSIMLYRNAVARWFSTLNGFEPTERLAQAYVDKLARTRSASTANLNAHAIMKYFKWKGKTVELECPSIPAPNPDYLSMDQVYALMNACTSLLEEVLIIVLFDTGVRISELLNLKVSGIDWRNSFITVTRKGGRVEIVNISSKALAVLAKWIGMRAADDERVLMGLTYHEAWRTIKKVGKRTGINIHPHMLRHSRAVQLLLDGAEMNIVKEHLGHVNIATTINIYGKLRAIDVKGKLKPW